MLSTRSSTEVFVLVEKASWLYLGFPAARGPEEGMTNCLDFVHLRAAMFGLVFANTCKGNTHNLAE